MHRPVDPTRLVGRSVTITTADGPRHASVRAVGPAGVSLDVRGDAFLLHAGEIGRLHPT